jgi:signal transduction histidine kinase/integral membrane sensor domain MASE1
MSSVRGARPPYARLSAFVDGAKGPVLVAILYFVAAEAAFLVGTLSDKIFAPFWPPNIVLFCALLLVPLRLWWLYVVAAFPAHVLAELGIGMSAPQLLVAFATNCMIAVFNAAAVRKFLGGPPWFGSLRKASLYVLITALAGPAISAVGGAFVRILGGGAVENYGVYAVQWYASNALSGLTLGPIALISLSEGRGFLASLPIRQKAEALLIAVGLVVAYEVALAIGAGNVSSSFLPAILYAPLPLILWPVVRFGAKGASAAILIVTLVLVSSALQGPSLFVAGDAETNVLALQAFIVSLAVPMLLLGASIDETRSAERATRKSEERMTFAAANVDIGFWHLDGGTGELWLTDHCRTMLRLPPDAEITRETIVRMIHPEDREPVIESMRGIARAGAVALNEFRVVLPGEEIRWCLVRSYVEPHAEGTPAHISGFFADITRRKTAEAEAEHHRQELSHLLRVSVMGELSGAIAHELHQPLTAMLSNAQAAQRLLAQDSPPLDQLRDIIEDIVQDDIRAGEVIRRLRGLLRKGESRVEAVDLNNLVRSTVPLLQSDLIGRKVKLDMNLAGALPSCAGDPVQLQQVLLNLTMNAVEAVSAVPPWRRTITISTDATATGIELCVADRGRGIAPHDRELVLRPFFTTSEHGLGLGLSISAKIVGAHGGELKLTDNAAGGVTAIVRLPTQPARAVAAAG